MFQGVFVALYKIAIYYKIVLLISNMKNTYMLQVWLTGGGPQDTRNGVIEPAVTLSARSSEGAKGECAEVRVRLAFS